MRPGLRHAALAAAFLVSGLVPAAHPTGRPASARVAFAEGTPIAVTVTPTVVPVVGGPVVVTGQDFGATKLAFPKLGWTATVDTKAAKLTWLSPTSVTLAVPAGALGASPSIVLSRGADSSAPDTSSVRYGAAITRATATAEPTGPLLKLTGSGFTGSDGWQLVPEGGGGTAVELPLAEDSSAPGVVITSDTTATVKLPVAPGPAGAYQVSFLPAAEAPFVASDAGRYVYKLPTVTGLSAAAISVAGSTFAIKGTGLSAVDRADPAAVMLTSTADPGTVVPLTVTEGSDTALKVTSPPAEPGDYTLTVTTPLGTAASKTKVGLSIVTPLGVALPEGAAAPAPGGVLTVVGTGFGATKAAFGSAKITATVGGKKAAVTWVSDTQLGVAMPAADPGTSATVVINRRDVPSAPLQVPYKVAVAKMSAGTGPAAGGTVLTVTGRGFKGASEWTLVTDGGNVVAALPVVASLDGLEPGVVVTDDTKATVRMPPSDTPFRMVVLTVNPDQSFYPEAGYLPTSRAVFVYSAAG